MLPLPLTPPGVSLPCSIPTFQVQLLNIESTQSQQRIFSALKEGTSAMKEMQQVGRGAGLRRTRLKGAGRLVGGLARGLDSPRLLSPGCR